LSLAFDLAASAVLAKQEADALAEAQGEGEPEVEEIYL